MPEDRDDFNRQRGEQLRDRQRLPADGDEPDRAAEYEQGKRESLVDRVRTAQQEDQQRRDRETAERFDDLEQRQQVPDDGPLLTRPHDWSDGSPDTLEAQHLHTQLSVVLMRQLSPESRLECLQMLRDALDRIERKELS